MLAACLGQARHQLPCLLHAAGCPDKLWWMIRRLESGAPITTSGFGRKSPQAASKLAVEGEVTEWGVEHIHTQQRV